MSVLNMAVFFLQIRGEEGGTNLDTNNFNVTAFHLSFDAVQNHFSSKMANHLGQIRSQLVTQL